ncbi:MAG: DNA-3-methyladenine glycosylase [Gemmatimonadaceae bacterium]|nr:DNA-3-methyladenine glycosylase [Gemmatimonadaceae bacterium]
MSGVPRPAPTNAAVPSGRRRASLWGAALPTAFYDRDVAVVARELLGAVLVVERAGELLAGRIVETEAYAGRDDPASHAFRGETPRTRDLFGTPGTIYIYRSYGVHWCANAVTAPRRHGSAVLLRAIEPLTGLDEMQARRGTRDPRAVGSGPGKLSTALGLSGDDSGGRWTRGPLTIRRGAAVADADILVTPRVGISVAVDWPLRFAVRGHPHASRGDGWRPLPLRTRK